MTAPEKYLKSHLDLVEKTLLCRSIVAASSGHPVLKGTIREDFVREFISGHIGSDVGVSPGEIFDSERVIPGPSHQIDVIIYGRDFPKIQMSESTYAFMIESVHATIEIKSTLDFAQLSKAYETASEILNLKNDMAKQRNWRTWCYLVAYDSTAKIPTVAEWLLKAAEADSCKATDNALGGVIVLGKGIVVSPSVAYFMKDREPRKPADPVAFNRDWVYVEQDCGNLYALFFALNFLRYGINIRQYFHGVLPSYKVASTRQERHDAQG
jgi:hypothetical protein